MGKYYDGTKLLSMLDIMVTNQRFICVQQTVLVVKQHTLADCV